MQSYFYLGKKGNFYVYFLHFITPNDKSPHSKNDSERNYVINQ